MEAPATVGLLYDTLDSLVALKLDLMHGDRAPTFMAPDRRQRMCADIDHSIDNIRGVIGALEGRRELCASNR